MNHSTATLITRRLATAMSIVLALSLMVIPVMAVINPNLQPRHLLERYKTAVIGTVTAIDETKKTVTLKITRVVKGTFAATNVILTASDDAAQGLFSISKGQSVVAFIGNKKDAGKILFYTGTWNTGLIADAAKPGEWNWVTVELSNEMVGIFNGAVEQLASLLADAVDNRDYFPATPLIKFQNDRVLGTLAQPVCGVALADLNNDGRLDAVATSTAGVRVWLQREGIRFDDTTSALGLEGAPATSVAVADADGDGLVDLLLDGVLWKGSAKGFAKTGSVPAITGLITATFQDMDGDGWPDVLAATRAGAKVYLNPAQASASFVDATSRLGLDKPECGGGQAGLVSAGDWNDDGRTDLFLAAGTGYLLVRGQTGVFQPRTHSLDLGLKAADDGELCGGAAFATLWRHDTASLLVPRHAGFALMVDQDGKLADIIGYCNETSEPSGRQLWTLAEDLNADGQVDIYTASGSKGSSDVCHLNRGYGSFMRPMKYNGSAFPGEGYAAGSWGVAVGDVNGDGAMDMLLGGSDGGVRLLLNDSLSLRGNVDENTASFYLTQLTGARIIKVDLTGRGALGASITLRHDERNVVVAQRSMGGNGVAGSWSGGPLAIAIREPGNYSLTVRRSDGGISTQKLKIDPSRPLVTTLKFDSATK